MAESGPDYAFDDDDPPAGALDTPATSQAVAEYLVDMIGQLETMARASGLDLVSYLLSMARSEAQIQARERD